MERVASPLPTFPPSTAATIATTPAIAHSLPSAIHIRRSMHAALQPAMPHRLSESHTESGLNVRDARTSARIAHIKVRVQRAVRRQVASRNDRRRRHRTRKTGARAGDARCDYLPLSTSQSLRHHSLLPSIVASSLSLTLACTHLPQARRLCFGIAIASPST